MSSTIAVGDVVRLTRESFLYYRSIINRTYFISPSWHKYSAGRANKGKLALRDAGGLVLRPEGDRWIVKHLDPRKFPRIVSVCMIDIERVNEVEAMRMCSVWT